MSVKWSAKTYREKERKGQRSARGTTYLPQGGDISGSSPVRPIANFGLLPTASAILFLCTSDVPGDVLALPSVRPKSVGWSSDIERGTWDRGNRQLRRRSSRRAQCAVESVMMVLPGSSARRKRHGDQPNVRATFNGMGRAAQNLREAIIRSPTRQTFVAGARLLQQLAQRLAVPVRSTAGWLTFI
jgi:hypothetical protein